MANLTYIEDLSDNALEVVLEVRSGAECVTVDHLSQDERVSVCKALGVEAPGHWLRGLDYAPPDLARPHPAYVGIDYEGAILEQAERFDHE